MYRWCGLVQLSREILLNIQRSSKHPRCQAHFITKNFPLSYFLCLSADFAQTMRNDVKWSYRHSCQHLEFSISNISVKLNIPLFKNVKIIKVNCHMPKLWQVCCDTFPVVSRKQRVHPKEKQGQIKTQLWVNCTSFT